MDNHTFFIIRHGFHALDLPDKHIQSVQSISYWQHQQQYKKQYAKYIGPLVYYPPDKGNQADNTEYGTDEGGKSDRQDHILFRAAAQQ